MRSILAKKGGRTFLPDEFMLGHELCFLLHDFLAELLRSAEAERVFTKKVLFADEPDRRAFEESADVLEWFEKTGRVSERAEFFRLTVFPGLLSDFLHFIYEALESSRKAKLNVSYALLRKPIQENLFLLEVIASDLAGFSERFVENPLRLRSQKAGGVEAHARRIASVLQTFGADTRFDSSYLAQLRYDKSTEDGFDGICNTAIHLFTEHEAIRTEKMNINFIFSGWDSKLTQWGYLYSRLPYLLSYAHCLVEQVFGSFQKSDDVYVAYAERRLAATTLLWSDTIGTQYRHPKLDKFVASVRQTLIQACSAGGWRSPTRDDLIRMRADGAWPGEGRLSVALRDIRFSARSRVGGLLAGATSGNLSRREHT